MASSEGLGSARSREATLFTFPSTTGTGVLKAIEATAAAVYGPIPGSLTNSSYSRGMIPSYPPSASFVDTITASACSLRARE